MNYTCRVRDKLHDYLLQRPAGAPADELVGVVFRQPGADPALARRAVEDLLGSDARFALRENDGTWHAREHAKLALPLIEATFTVIDLEMTGMEASRSGIIEIGAARVSGGRVVDEFQQLVNPGVRLPPFIVGLTGIDDEMLADAPGIAEVWPTFRAFAGDTVLVAHNAAFDITCLNRTSVQMTGRPLDNEQLCTLKLARQLLPDLDKRGLDALAGYFGIVQADRHRALGDVRVTVEVLFRLLELLAERGVERLDQALEFQNRARDGKPFVSFLPRDRVLGLPDTPGIYRLLGEDGSLLYVGKAKSLRERVASYLSNAAGHSDKTLEMIRAAHDVRVETSGSELEAALAEAEAIRRDKPPYNKLGRHLPRVAFIKLSVADTFPRLSVARKLTTRGRSRFLGPFRNIKEAERIVDVLTREFQLRTCPGSLEPDPATEPCSQHRLGRCTAPCSALVSADAYRAQVDQMLGLLRGDLGDLHELLERRVRDRERRGAHEAAAYSQREIEALRSLARSQKHLGWLLDHRDWVVLDLAVDRPVVLAYGVVASKLVVRTRLNDESEVESFAEALRTHLANPPAASPEHVEGTTIVAAWMRDHAARPGCVIPIENESIPPELVAEWRSVCRDLLSTPRGLDAANSLAR